MSLVPTIHQLYRHGLVLSNGAIERLVGSKKIDKTISGILFRYYGLLGSQAAVELGLKYSLGDDLSSRNIERDDTSELMNRSKLLSDLFQSVAKLLRDSGRVSNAQMDAEIEIPKHLIGYFVGLPMADFSAQTSIAAEQQAVQTFVNQDREETSRYTRLLFDFLIEKPEATCTVSELIEFEQFLLRRSPLVASDGYFTWRDLIDAWFKKKHATEVDELLALLDRKHKGWDPQLQEQIKTGKREWQSHHDIKKVRKLLVSCYDFESDDEDVQDAQDCIRGCLEKDPNVRLDQLFEMAKEKIRDAVKVKRVFELIIRQKSNLEAEFYDQVTTAQETWKNGGQLKALVRLFDRQEETGQLPSGLQEEIAAWVKGKSDKHALFQKAREKADESEEERSIKSKKVYDWVKGHKIVLKHFRSKQHPKTSFPEFLTQRTLSVIFRDHLQVVDQAEGFKKGPLSSIVQELSEAFLDDDQVRREANFFTHVIDEVRREGKESLCRHPKLQLYRSHVAKTSPIRRFLVACEWYINFVEKNPRKPDNGSKLFADFYAVCFEEGVDSESESRAHLVQRTLKVIFIDYLKIVDTEMELKKEPFHTVYQELSRLFTSNEKVRRASLLLAGTIIYQMEREEELDGSMLDHSLLEPYKQALRRMRDVSRFFSACKWMKTLIQKIHFRPGAKNRARLFAYLYAATEEAQQQFVEIFRTNPLEVRGFAGTDGFNSDGWEDRVDVGWPESLLSGVSGSSDEEVTELSVPPLWSGDQPLGDAQDDEWSHLEGSFLQTYDELEVLFRQVEAFEGSLTKIGDRNRLEKLSVLVQFDNLIPVIRFLHEMLGDEKEGIEACRTQIFALLQVLVETGETFVDLDWLYDHVDRIQQAIKFKRENSVPIARCLFELREELGDEECSRQLDVFIEGVDAERLDQVYSAETITCALENCFLHRLRMNAMLRLGHKAATVIELKITDRLLVMGFPLFDVQSEELTEAQIKLLHDLKGFSLCAEECVLLFFESLQFQPKKGENNDSWQMTFEEHVAFLQEIEAFTRQKLPPDLVFDTLAIHHMCLEHQQHFRQLKALRQRLMTEELGRFTLSCTAEIFNAVSHCTVDGGKTPRRYRFMQEENRFNGKHVGTLTSSLLYSLFVPPQTEDMKQTSFFPKTFPFNVETDTTPILEINSTPTPYVLQWHRGSDYWDLSLSMLRSLEEPETRTTCARLKVPRELIQSHPKFEAILSTMITCLSQEQDLSDEDALSIVNFPKDASIVDQFFFYIRLHPAFLQDFVYRLGMSRYFGDYKVELSRQLYFLEISHQSKVKKSARQREHLSSQLSHYRAIHQIEREMEYLEEALAALDETLIEAFKKHEPLLDGLIAQKKTEKEYEERIASAQTQQRELRAHIERLDALIQYEQDEDGHSYDDPRWLLLEYGKFLTQLGELESHTQHSEERDVTRYLDEWTKVIERQLTDLRSHFSEEGYQELTFPTLEEELSALEEIELHLPLYSVSLQGLDNQESRLRAHLGKLEAFIEYSNHPEQQNEDDVEKRLLDATDHVEINRLRKEFFGEAYQDSVFQSFQEEQEGCLEQIDEITKKRKELNDQLSDSYKRHLMKQKGKVTDLIAAKENREQMERHTIEWLLLDWYDHLEYLQRIKGCLAEAKDSIAPIIKEWREKLTRQIRTLRSAQFGDKYKDTERVAIQDERDQAVEELEALEKEEKELDEGVQCYRALQADQDKREEWDAYKQNNTALIEAKDKLRNTLSQIGSMETPTDAAVPPEEIEAFLAERYDSAISRHRLKAWLDVLHKEFEETWKPKWVEELAPNSSESQQLFWMMVQAFDFIKELKVGVRRVLLEFSTGENLVPLVEGMKTKELAALGNIYYTKTGPSLLPPLHNTTIKACYQLNIKDKVFDDLANDIRNKTPTKLREIFKEKEIGFKEFNISISISEDGHYIDMQLERIPVSCSVMYPLDLTHKQMVELLKWQVVRLKGLFYKHLKDHGYPEMQSIVEDPLDPLTEGLSDSDIESF